MRMMRRTWWWLFQLEERACDLCYAQDSMLFSVSVSLHSLESQISPTTRRLREAGHGAMPGTKKMPDLGT